MHPRAVLLLSVVATAAFLLASLASTLSLLGHPARLVDVVGLFFGGFGSGASVVATVLTVRHGVGSK